MKININEERFNGDNFAIDKERQIEGTLASNVKPWLKYYNVDINFLDKDAVRALRREGLSE